MVTRFPQLVGCPVPVQQAPMGAVSSPDLVVAVADAGGLGTLSTLGLPPELVLRRLVDIRARTTGALAVNVVDPTVDERLLQDLAERVGVVDFFWFDPSPRLVSLVHDAGALVNWQVGSPEEALRAEDAGCDLVTAQGTEAGGHVRGSTPLLPLLEAVLDDVGVPVLAAGGIADARSAAAALSAGADGVRVGTRFVATVESGALPGYKQALVDAAAGSTVLTDAFATGCPLCATSPRTRVLRSAVDRVTAFAEDVVGTATLGDRRVSLPRGSGLPPVEGVEGDLDAMALYAGAGVGSVTGIRPAAEVVAELAAASAGAATAPG